MKLFDIQPGQRADPSKLRWPHREEVQGDEAAPAGNQQYQDLRGFKWPHVTRIVEFEAGLMARLEGASDPAKEEELIFEALSQAAEFTYGQTLHGLDVGVASAVLAVSAAGAIPVASCNGGAFGGFHQATNPLVGFYARPRRFLAIERWAQQAQLRLDITDEGLAILYARRVIDFLAFAKIALVQQDRGLHDG